MAVVGGEAGIGKTRLVRELVERVPEGVVVAFGHAVPLTGGPLPYGVAADLLRSLVRAVHVKVVDEALGPRAVVLAPLVPRLGDGADAVLDRSAVYAATQDLLAELSADQTLLLVLEDLHWADESSLDLVTFWARTLVRGRLLLVATSRDQGVDEKVLARVGELRRLPNATVLDLSPLPAEGVEAQVRSLDETAEADLVAEILRLSDGNPLFVEELVAGGVGRPLRHLEPRPVRDLGRRVAGGRRPAPARRRRAARLHRRDPGRRRRQPRSEVEAALDEGASGAWSGAMLGRSGRSTTSCCGRPCWPRAPRPSVMPAIDSGRSRCPVSAPRPATWCPPRTTGTRRALSRRPSTRGFVRPGR